jgi:hypothetical protein
MPFGFASFASARSAIRLTIRQRMRGAAFIAKDRNDVRRTQLGCTFENVPVLLKAPQVRLEQAKCPFGLPCIHPGSPQTDYEALLLLYDATPLGNEFLGAAKIVCGIHLSK